MKVVYVTHNGVGTALVRSQVLPYLRELLQAGVSIELVTFERGAPPREPAGFPAERWHAALARPGGGLLAKLRDTLSGVGLVFSLLQGASIVHARSYLPAGIAWVARLLRRRPYVFDMRGFLPDEYLEGGRWTAADPRYRLLRFAERWLLRDAAAIVVLTEQGKIRLRTERRYASAVRATPISVIPCAVDLDRFSAGDVRSATPTLVYCGSVGMWYALDEMLQVFAAARAAVPALRFLVLNIGQHELIHERVRAHGLTEAVEVRAATFEEVPGLLAGAHVGICLLRQASSKLGSSPIKVAEYLAAGLPVIANAGQGDTDALLRRYSAGHVMEGYGESEIAAAAAALVSLLGDATARRNARELAEREYSAVRAAEIYLRIYEEIARRAG